MDINSTDNGPLFFFLEYLEYWNNISKETTIDSLEAHV
jgi:hypothetical protein